MGCHREMSELQCEMKLQARAEIFFLFLSALNRIPQFMCCKRSGDFYSALTSLFLWKAFRRNI